jgi:hypothetical protein
MKRIGTTLTLLCFSLCATFASLALLHFMHRIEDYRDGMLSLGMNGTLFVQPSDMSPQAAGLLTIFCVALTTATLLFLAYRHRVRN